MELALEAIARSEGRLEGRIDGMIKMARRHGLSDDVIAMGLVEDCGLSQEEAFDEIWKYEHPEVQG